jgi:cytochrome bd-type quinol oxidase subunit 2
VTDDELRSYLGVLSFLLAALSFLANERRAAVDSLDERTDVTGVEKWATFATVLLLFLAALGLVASAWPAVNATALELDDVLRLRSAIRQAFILGWVLLIAIAIALGALAWRAARITPKVS